MTTVVLLTTLGAGGLIALLVLVRAVLERSIGAAALGALLLIAAAAGALIVLSWEIFATSVRALQFAELLLTMMIGPVVLLATKGLVHARLSSWWPVGIGMAGLILLTADTLRHGGDPIVHAVPVQALFTLWSWALYLRERNIVEMRASRAWRRRWLAFWLLIAVSLVNVASLARLAFPEAAILKPAVPVAIALLFVLLFLTAAWTLIGRHGALLAPRAAPDSAEGRLAMQAAELIEGEKLFRDPDLDAAAVAARLDVPVSRLAAALSSSRWGSFAALLQSLRLSAARRMLVDPAEHHTSIDAIGLLCGFRSRSAFYDLFRRELGISPGAYRRRGSSLSG